MHFSSLPVLNQLKKPLSSHIGLSMSHDIIVKQHGGSINVETEPGVFTEFIIILPRGNTASDSKPE